MPMLNLLRPHRRSASAQSTPTQDTLHHQQQQQQQQQQHHRSHAQSTTTLHFLPPAQRQHSPSPPPPPSQASLDHHASTSTLPPLNFGSSSLLGPTSPSGFLNSAFGSSSNSLAPQTPSATATTGNIANGGSSKPVITTTGSSPRLGSPSLNKALPAPPPRTPPPQTLHPPQSLQSPSSPSSAHSRPGTGGSGKHALGSSSTPQLPPLLTSFGKHKEKEKEANSHSTIPTSSSGHGKRNHAKLNLLNPMTLLMRRRTAQNGTQGESSRKAGPRELPADFDPGIIYATRHLDWSSPGKRPPVDVINARTKDGRIQSPALAGMRAEGEDHGDRQRTPMFKECFGEDVATPKMQVGQQGSPPPAPKIAGPAMARGAPPPQLALQPLQEVKTPQIPQTPQTAILTSPAVSMGTTLVEKTPPMGQPLPLTDSPAILAPARSNASSSSSASENDDDAYPRMRRKGVTLVDHPLSLPRHLMNNSSRFSFEASSAAGSSPGLDDERDLGDVSQVPSDPNLAGFANDGAPSSVRQPPGGIGLGLGLGLGASTPAGVGAEADINHKKLYPRRAPSRWRDDEDVVDMTTYENEDDDLYYDDGMILGDDDGEEQGFGNGDDDVYGMGTSRLGLGGISVQALPQSGQDGISSGNDLAVETASLEPTIGGMRNSNGPTAFPPFMNPIGGGLGYQKQLEHFYTPDIMRMNTHGLPLALQTLDQSLCKIQQQQQQKQDDGLDSPAPGFGNEVDPSYVELQQSILRAEAEEEEAMRMNFDDEDDEDDPMVAAANAEALAFDTEGEYGQEFGFYSATKADGNVSAEQLYAGGYFGEPSLGGPPRPFLVRRPSLTPISERSECSYRNSMVFGFESGPPGSRGGGGSGAHPLALSQSLAGLTLNGDGTVQGQVQEGDMSLSQLLKLRRSWGGGSQAGSVKSPPGSPGGGHGAVNGGGEASPDMGSPVVGPGQGGHGQLGMSPGGYGMGMYGVNSGDWSEYAGSGAGGVPLGLPHGMNLMGMGMVNGLHMGTIQQQINQMSQNAGSPVGPPQFYQTLKGGNPQNTHNPGEGNLYPSLHGYQPGLGGGQFHPQQQQQQQTLDDDYGDDIDGFDGEMDGFDDDLDEDILDDYNYQNTPQQPQPFHQQDQANPNAHNHTQPTKVITGLARNTSAGQKSIAGDSSYASALGSPTTSEAARGDGRISMDEQIGIGGAGVR